MKHLLPQYWFCKMQNKNFVANENSPYCHTQHIKGPQSPVRMNGPNPWRRCLTILCMCENGPSFFSSACSGPIAIYHVGEQIALHIICPGWAAVYILSVYNKSWCWQHSTFIWPWTRACSWCCFRGEHQAVLIDEVAFGGIFSVMFYCSPDWTTLVLAQAEDGH